MISRQEIDRIRAEAFIDTPRLLYIGIFSPKVVPLTPYMLHLLSGLKSPLLHGWGTRRDIRIALFILSGQYKPSFWAYLRWRAYNPWLQYERAGKAILEHFTEATCDFPRVGREAGSKQEQVDPFPLIAQMVVYFAKTFGWSEEQIMHTPIARLYQYMTLSIPDSGGPKFSANDELTAKYLQKQNTTVQRKKRV